MSLQNKIEGEKKANGLETPALSNTSFRPSNSVRPRRDRDTADNTAGSDSAQGKHSEYRDGGGGGEKRNMGNLDAGRGMEQDVNWINVFWQF